jgi:hypothetical protein
MTSLYAAICMSVDLKMEWDKLEAFFFAENPVGVLVFICATLLTLKRYR